MTMNRDKVVSQLRADLDAVRGFERNVNNLLNAMREPNPSADYVSEARGLRYNQQYIAYYLGRASAVLEAIGECQPGELTTSDQLEAEIHAIMCDFPD